MPCGKIMSQTKRRPKIMEGKSFVYRYNPRNKMYVKFRKK